MFDALRRRVLGGDAAARRAQLEVELARVQEGLALRRGQLAEKKEKRLEALFPQGAVPGAGPAPGGGARFPDLDPMNFEDPSEASWLLSVATGIIDRFPGGEALLSQLDATHRAFHEASDLRIEPGGPDEDLLPWRDAALAAWDLPPGITMFMTTLGGGRVLGCAEPFVVMDRLELAGLDAPQRRFVVTATLGHVFFGNLRIFAFHRLMDVIEKMPSMGGLVAKGVGLIPVVGPTISRGIELAKTVNDQMIRKTALVMGVRQNLLCDRLAVLTQADPRPAQRFFVRAVAGDCPPEGPAFQRLLERVVEQGRNVQAALDQARTDLHLLSVVGPKASFAAYRAYKLSRWLEDDRSTRIARGLYVTRARRKEYEKTHQALEEEIRKIEERILDLHESAEKLQADLRALEAAAQAEGVTADDPRP